MNDQDLKAKAQHLEAVVASGDVHKLGASLLQEYLATGSDKGEFTRLLKETKALNDTDRKRFAFLPTIDFTNPNARNFEVDLGRLSPGLSFLISGTLDKSPEVAFQVKQESGQDSLLDPYPDDVGRPFGKGAAIVDGLKSDSISNSILIAQNGAVAEPLLPFEDAVVRPGSTLVEKNDPFWDGNVCVESGAILHVESAQERGEIFAEPQATIHGDVAFNAVQTGFCEQLFIPAVLKKDTR